MAKKVIDESVDPKSLKGADKLAALKATLDKINKSYGDGSVMPLGSQTTFEVDVIPSGSIALDYALGIGGYPRGRIVEIFGPESSGKTTLAIHAIAECLKQGGVAAFIDAEHAFDKYYAKALGVDVDSLLISQPDCGEQALDIADDLIKSGYVDIIVVDSVAALTPKAELEGAMGDARIGLLARLMSQALRKITASVSKTKTCCIFINQLRDKIGVMFGNPETTTGGNALKFYSSIRVDVRRSSLVKDGDEVIANLTKVKIVKNKMAPPFRKCEFNIEYGKGISHEGEICDMAIALDIIHRSGSWFSYNDERLCQGRDNVLELLNENTELRDEIEAKVRENIKNIHVEE